MELLHTSTSCFRYHNKASGGTPEASAATYTTLLSSVPTRICIATNNGCHVFRLSQTQTCYGCSIAISNLTSVYMTILHGPHHTVITTLLPHGHPMSPPRLAQITTMSSMGKPWAQPPSHPKRKRRSQIPVTETWGNHKLCNGMMQ